MVLRAEHGIEVLDWDFIRGHTAGIDALAADLRATRWEDIERRSGLSRQAIEETAQVYAKAERAIIVYGMGITQHWRGARNVQQLANLALLRGHVGREGAGTLPRTRALQRAGRSHCRYHRDPHTGVPE